MKVQSVSETTDCWCQKMFERPNERITSSSNPLAHMEQKHVLEEKKRTYFNNVSNSIHFCHEKKFFGEQQRQKHWPRERPGQRYCTSRT